MARLGGGCSNRPNLTMARFGRDMLIYSGADLLGAAIGLVLSPLFTRLFTPEQYGTQAALAAIWSFVCLVQYGGMDMAYSYFRAQTADQNERRRLMVTASFIALASLVGVTCLFGFTALVTNWVADFAAVSRGEMLAYVATLAPGALMAWYLYLLRFERRAAAFARVSLLGRVVSYLLLVPALSLAQQADRLVVGFVVVAAVGWIAVALGWWEVRRAQLAPFAPEFFDRERARTMLRFGLVLIPSSALYCLSTVLDRLAVTWFAGQAETAVLSLGLRLAMVATMLRTWFALVWDPQLIEWVATAPRELLVTRLEAAALLVARAACLLVFLAAIWVGPVVEFIYPSHYWPSARLVPWIVFGVAASSLSLIAVATILIAKKPRLYLPVYALGLAINFGIAWASIPRLGAIGAVVGAAAGECFILVAWVLLGTRILRNLPLRWAGHLAMLAVAGIFVALYHPGRLLPIAPLWDRILMSGAVLAVLAVPAIRQWRRAARQIQP